MTQKKMPKGSLLLAGLAAFAYYKYSKLTPEKKQDLTSTIKEKGKEFYNKYVPEEIKSFIGKPSEEAPGSTKHNEYPAN